MIRNANRIDHVAALVRPENLDSTAARLAEVLQVAFFPAFERPEAGLRVAASIDGGIELIAPNSDDPDNPLGKLLAARGEHWLSVVFGVADMDAACERFAKMGYKPQMRRPGLFGDEPWAGRIARVEQAMFEPGLTGGLPMAFCCVEEADQRL